MHGDIAPGRYSGICSLRTRLAARERAYIEKLAPCAGGKPVSVLYPSLRSKLQVVACQQHADRRNTCRVHGTAAEPQLPIDNESDW